MRDEVKTSVKILSASLLAFIAGLSINNVAMSDIAAQKVAVVDVPAIVAKSSQVSSLKKEQETKLAELQKWINTAKADVENQKTQERKDKLAKKYDAELLKKKEAIQKNYALKLSAIDKSISATIAEQAKVNGYGLVLSKGVVLYGGDDITAIIQKVVK